MIFEVAHSANILFLINVSLIFGKTWVTKTHDLNKLAMFVNKINFFWPGRKQIICFLSEMLFTYKESNFNIRMRNVTILQAISGICYVIARGVTIEWTPGTIFSWLG